MELVCLVYLTLLNFAAFQISHHQIGHVHAKMGLSLQTVLIKLLGARGGAVIEALRYKPKVAGSI
jgi:hypothetical protein